MAKKRATIENVTLFVLIGPKDKREVRRAPLSKELQVELSKHFAARYEAEYAAGTHVLAYEAGYRPDPHEVSEIAKFSPPPALVEALQDPASPPVVTKEEIAKAARVLVACDPELGLSLFQLLDARTIVRSGLPIVLSGDHFRKQDFTGIVVRDQIQAAFFDGALRFHSFYLASQIFDLTDYFEEASNEQVDEFLAHEKIAETKVEQFRIALDTWSRRKIRSIQVRGTLDKVKPAAWKEAADKCGIELTLTGRPPALVLPTAKKELRQVLRLLDDDYLDSIVQKGTTFQVSSKRIVRGARS